jgi:peptide deformylase
MAVREILLLGNPLLYQSALPVAPEDLDGLHATIADLHDTLMAFRSRYGKGRAMAAPQVGVPRRLVYMCIDRPMVFLNPVLEGLSEEMFEVWDDCMSFPDLLVRVRRHARCTLRYRDLSWESQTLVLEGSLSELLQHECDHLDGILATQRAIDARSFALFSPPRD